MMVYFEHHNPKCVNHRSLEVTFMKKHKLLYNLNICTDVWKISMSVLQNIFSHYEQNILQNMLYWSSFGFSKSYPVICMILSKTQRYGKYI